MLAAAAKFNPAGIPLRFVQIGTASGADISLPGAVLRSSAIELKGSGLGSVATSRLLASIGGVFDAAAKGFVTMKTKIAPLADVERVWREKSDERIVFLTG